MFRDVPVFRCSGVPGSTTCPFFEGKPPRDVRIRYREDEDTFGNLSCDEDLGLEGFVVL